MPSSHAFNRLLAAVSMPSNAGPPVVARSVMPMRSFVHRILLGTLVFTCAQAAASLEAPMVLALVKSHGAPETASRLWRSEHDTRQFLAGIRSGHPDWLSAAEAVVPGADAGASEELNAAFADALIVNPYALLPWLQKPWWAGSSAVCVFGEDSELPGGLSMYLSRLEASLSKDAPRDLSDLRQQCLRGIEQTRNALPPGAGAQGNDVVVTSFPRGLTSSAVEGDKAEHAPLLLPL